MLTLEVNTDALADGLKTGIAHTDTLHRYSEPKNMLRTAACGMVSSAIATYVEAKNIPVRLGISHPLFDFDIDMAHVFPMLGDQQSPLIVDASYSQFLDYVGLSTGYEHYSGEDAFPDDEVLAFKPSHRLDVANWLAGIATKFVENSSHPIVYGIDMGVGPLSDKSAEEIEGHYAEIWNPANTRIWAPPDHVIEDGRIIAHHIPNDAIVIL